MMVVLISGVSLAGYAACASWAPATARRSLGLMGGLVSSTATTMVFSATPARTRRWPPPPPW